MPHKSTVKSVHRKAEHDSRWSERESEKERHRDSEPQKVREKQ